MQEEKSGILWQEISSLSKNFNNYIKGRRYLASCGTIMTFIGSGYTGPRFRDEYGYDHNINLKGEPDMFSKDKIGYLEFEESIYDGK